MKTMTCTAIAAALVLVGFSLQTIMSTANGVVQLSTAPAVRGRVLALYLAVFMVWLGKYSWLKGITVGVAISVVMFLMFEVWFLVPLYKGAYNPLSFIGY